MKGLCDRYDNDFMYSLVPKIYKLCFCIKKKVTNTKLALTLLVQAHQGLVTYNIQVLRHKSLKS